MSPITRRVVYVTLYEAIAMVAATIGLTLLSSAPAEHTAPLAVASSIVAVVWNYVFNWGFEAWEARQDVGGRSWGRRVAHAIGFEGGLVLILVPLVAWWLDVSFVEAFLYDLALVVFFLVYTFVFNLTFDQIFGLPASAQR